jgi:hypothetical protein
MPLAAGRSADIAVDVPWPLPAGAPTSPTADDTGVDMTLDYAAAPGAPFRTLQYVLPPPCTHNAHLSHALRVLVLPTAAAGVAVAAALEPGGDAGTVELVLALRNDSTTTMAVETLPHGSAAYGAPRIADAFSSCVIESGTVARIKVALTRPADGIPCMASAATPCTVGHAGCALAWCALRCCC